MNTYNDTVLLVREFLASRPDLRRSEYTLNDHPLSGHCYVASEALFHLLGPDDWKPMVVTYYEVKHWFLQHRQSGWIIDATHAQFETEVPHHLAKGCGFLTKSPSQRAQIVIDYVNTDPGPSQVGAEGTPQ